LAWWLESWWPWPCPRRSGTPASGCEGTTSPSPPSPSGDHPDPGHQLGGHRRRPRPQSAVPKDSLLAFQFHTSKYPYYYIMLALLALCMLVSWRIERTRLGYYFRAIREDPAAAQSVGISITKYKLIAMAISAAFVAAEGPLRPVRPLPRPRQRLPAVPVHPDLRSGGGGRRGHPVGRWWGRRS
jgi:hypothetical protein